MPKAQETLFFMTE